MGIDATDSIINAAYCALIPMRRSVRDAIVGFTVIGGIVSFAAMAMWMRGVRLGSSHWTVTASFEDAGGLAERSPVTYRGILVGSVRSVTVTPEAVVAELDIDKGDLRLAQPVTATVASASLLGGDAQVALVSRGTPLPNDAPLPSGSSKASSAAALDPIGMCCASLVGWWRCKGSGCPF